MDKNCVKKALLAAVIVSALYTPAKAAEHIVVPAGTTSSTTMNEYRGYSDSQGGVYLNNGTLNVLDGVTFTQNTAQNGGAIYTAAGAVTNIGNNVTFTNNLSNANYYGGSALYNVGSVIAGNNAKFNNNYINGVVDTVAREGTVGGAIANWNGGTISIGNYAEFKNNGYTDSTKTVIGVSDGGAIYNSGKTGVDGSMIIGSNAVFDGNTAVNRAGALYNGESHLEIGNNATITDNSANSYGAIYNYYSGQHKSDVVIKDNANISNNTAKTGNGGAIGNFYDDFTVGDNAVFHSNKAEHGFGGAVLNSSDTAAGNGTFTVGEHATFTGNIAQSGGAIYNDGKTSVVNINGGNTNVVTTFSGNTAADKGGAIYTEGQVNLNAANGDIIFSNNTAAHGSDIYLADGSKLVIDGAHNVTLKSSGTSVAGTGNIEKNGTGSLNLETGNFVEEYSGKYTQNAGKLSVTNTAMFTDADIKGGSIELHNGAKVDGANIKLADGTGIDIKDGTVEFTNNTTLIGATANTYVKNNDGATMKLKNVDFSGFLGTYNQSNGNFILENAKMFGKTNITGGDIDIKDNSTMVLSSLTGKDVNITNNSALTVNGLSNITNELTISDLSSVITNGLTVTGNTNINNADLTVNNALAKFSNYYVNKPVRRAYTPPLINSNGNFGSNFEADNLDITNHNMQVTGTTTVKQNAKITDSILHSTDKFAVGNTLTASGSEITVDANGMEVTGNADIINSSVNATGGLIFNRQTEINGSEITSNGDMTTSTSWAMIADDTKLTVNNGKFSGGALELKNNSNMTVNNGADKNNTVNNISLDGSSLKILNDGNLDIKMGLNKVDNGSVLDVKGNLTSVAGISAGGNAKNTINAGKNLTIGDASNSSSLNITNTDLSVGGNLSVSNEFNVTNSTANITGTGSVKGLSIAGTTSNVTFGDSVTVTDRGNLDVSGGTLTVNNSKDLNVTGNADLSNKGNITVGGNLGVDGNLTSLGGTITAGNMNVKGHAAISETIANITGTGVFNGGLLLQDNSEMTTGGKFTVTAGGLFLNNSKITVNSGGLDVNDDAEIKNDSYLNVTGDALFQDDLTVNKSTLTTAAGSDLTVIGKTILNDATTNFGGAIDFQGGLTTTGTSTLVMHTDLVANNLDFGENTRVTLDKGKAVIAAGPSNLNKTILTINNNTDDKNNTFGGDLNLTEGSKLDITDGNAAVGGNLNMSSVNNSKNQLLVNGDAAITGNINAATDNSAKKIDVTGSLTANNIDIKNGDLDAGSITANGTTVLTDTITNVTGDGIFTGGYTASGTAAGLSSTQINGNFTSNDLVLNNSSLTIDKIATVNGQTNLSNSSKLSIIKNAEFKGNVITNNSSIDIDGDMTAATSELNITDSTVDVANNTVLNQLTVNAGTKQSTLKVGKNLSTGITNTNNADIETGGNWTASGNTVLNKSAALIKGSSIFKNLEANKGEAASDTKYQIKTEGTLTADSIDVTNVNLEAGKGVIVLNDTLLNDSIVNFTGENVLNTLTANNSEINIYADLTGLEGNLTTSGLTELNKTVLKAEGNLNFDGGLKANKSVTHTPGEVVRQYLISSGGIVRASDMDVNDVIIVSKGMDIADNAQMYNTGIEATGHVYFQENLIAEKSKIIITKDLNNNTTGNLSVRGTALLTDTDVALAGDATFLHGLTANVSAPNYAEGTYKNNIVINGDAHIGDLGHLVTSNLDITRTSMSVLQDLIVTGTTDVKDKSDLHIHGDGLFTGKLTVDNHSSIETGNNLVFLDGFDLTNNSNAYIHGDPVLDGDINVTNGSVLNFVNPVNGFSTALGGNLLMDNGSINEMNNVITNNTFNGNFTIANNSTANFMVDIDPRAWKSDAFNFDNINSADGMSPANIMISDFNFSSYPLDRHIYLPQMFHSNTEIPDNINFLTNDKLVFSPIGWYGLYGSQGSGYRVSLAKYNPQVFRGQVATRAQHANQWVIDDILLNHALLQSNRILSEGKTANKYAAILPEFAPYQYDKKTGGLWFKSYGNFETISMTQGLDVKNNAYGALVGADFPVVEMKNGWQFLPTAYVAYTGAHQTFDYVGMYQNGGQAGAMGTFMKGNFIGSILANGGVYGNSMDVAGYTDETFNWFAGTAAKAAYDINVTKHFVVQPTLMAMYNTFGEQNWYSQFGAMGMYSGFLYGLNVAPGLNLIYGKKDWSVYATFQYVFNPLDNMQGHVGRSVDLPRIGLRHTFFEYGIGFTKMWKDRLNSYGQITFRNGGRTGVSFQLGLNWLF